MKYVIFKYNTLFMPIMCPDHVTHSQVKIEDAEPISAGFFEMGMIGPTKVYGHSESLDLKPHPRDLDLLQRSFLEMGTAYFIDPEIEKDTDGE
jgi:hypothetical protein